MNGQTVVKPERPNALFGDGGKSVAFQIVKLFELDRAAAFIQEAIRPIARAHVSTVDGTAIWEVVVGSYEWQDAAEEWGLHSWLRENGAIDGELVLVKSDDLS
jgi:hypothetical protein